MKSKKEENEIESASVPPSDSGGGVEVKGPSITLGGDEEENTLKVIQPQVKKWNQEEVEEMKNSLYSMWQFPAILQFFSLFQDTFLEEEFDHMELENALLYPLENPWIQVLQAKMLRMATKNRFALDDVWLLYVEREITKRVDEMLMPPSFFTLVEGEPLPLYESLSLSVRVHLLHFVCELQLERLENFKPYNDTPENVAANDWRIDPIGVDSNGTTYYLFDDTRLYASTKKEWKMVCGNIKEWEEFAEGFKESKGKHDKELYTLLTRKLLKAVAKDVESVEQMRLEKLKRAKEAEEARREEERREAEEERGRLEAESLRLALELEERRFNSRSLRATRAAPLRGMPAVEKTAAEIREERALKRQQRFEEDIFEDVPEDILNSTTTATVTETTTRKKRKKKPRKKGYVYSDEEEEEDDDDWDEEEEEIYTRPPPVNDGQPKRKVGRPRKYPRPEDLVPDEGVDGGGEDGEVWFFECVCGVSGQNIDDGTPIISCEVCSVWSHIQCTAKDVSPGEAVDVDLWLDKAYTCRKCVENPVNKDVLQVDVKAVSPKLKAASPQLKTASPRHLNGSPLVKAASPQLKATSPLLMNGSPQLKTASPQLMNGSPQHLNGGHLYGGPKSPTRIEKSPNASSPSKAHLHQISNGVQSTAPAPNASNFHH